MSAEQSHFEHPFYRIVLPLVLTATPVYWGWLDHSQKIQTPVPTSQSPQKILSEPQPQKSAVSPQQPAQIQPSANSSRQTEQKSQLVAATQDIAIHNKRAETSAASEAIQTKTPPDECSNPDVELRPIICMEGE